MQLKLVGFQCLALLVPFVFVAVQAAGMACDCSVDFCTKSDPSVLQNPTAMACFVNGTTEQMNATDFQFCSNKTHAMDFTSPGFWPPGITADMIVANTTNCAELLFNDILYAQWIVTDHVFNNSMIRLVQYEDCSLFIGGGIGAGDAEGQMSASDVFTFGNYDLEQAIFLSLISYAGNGTLPTMAVCGNMLDCPVTNKVTGNLTGVQPLLSFCIGGNYLGAVWNWWGGQGGPNPFAPNAPPAKISTLEDIYVDKTALQTIGEPDGDTDEDTDDYSPVERPLYSPNGRYVLQCRRDSIPSPISLYTDCVTSFHTSCTSDGRLLTTSHGCYVRCWCMETSKYRECVKGKKNSANEYNRVCPSQQHSYGYAISH